MKRRQATCSGRTNGNESGGQSFATMRRALHARLLASGCVFHPYESARWMGRSPLSSAQFTLAPCLSSSFTACARVQTRQDQG